MAMKAHYIRLVPSGQSRRQHSPRLPLQRLRLQGRPNGRSPSELITACWLGVGKHRDGLGRISPETPQADVTQVPRLLLELFLADLT